MAQPTPSPPANAFASRKGDEGNPPGHFLVTGATGQQGGAVARELLERGHKVRGSTRNPTNPKAEELRRLGAEIVKADYEKPESVQKAAKGVDGAFIMATPFEKGPDAETRQAKAAIDAAIQARVPHIVYSSVCNADQETGIPHFDSKCRVEEHLKGQGIPYTIVAPAFFRENMLANWMLPSVKEGHLDMALPSNRPLQTVELPEIARFTAEVLEDRDRFKNQRIDIASDDPTPSAMASAIEEATGQHVRHNEVPLESLRKQDKDMAKMFEWFDQVGYSADIPALRREYPDVAWRTFPEWAAEQAWGIAPPRSAERPPSGRRESARPAPAAQQGELAVGEAD